MTNDTSPPSVSGTTSVSKPGATGRRPTGGSSERTSVGLTANRDWIDVILGPCACQGCGRPLNWVRLVGIYRFWADAGADLPHRCNTAAVEVLAASTGDLALHRRTENWKKALSGQG